MLTPKNTRQGQRARVAPAKGGASHSKTGRADRFKAWLLHHQITAVESLIRLLITPVQSLMTWLVVAIALVLPTSLYVGLENVKHLGSNVENTGQMSVFIHKRARPEAIEKLSKRLLTKSEVARVELMTPAAALDEFRQHSGFGNILDSLDNNPLPTVLLIDPALERADHETLARLQKAILEDPIVEEVSVDLKWVERLNQMMVFAQRLVLALGALLALGVLLVIGNTIRLAIESRRDEILVVKLVGGTNAFVRRPFLYTGIWYGLGGGCLAALILAAGEAWLAGPVSALAELYQSNFELQGLSWDASILMILTASGVGLMGAWLAVGRHLGQIEPK